MDSINNQSVEARDEHIKERTSPKGFGEVLFEKAVKIIFPVAPISDFACRFHPMGFLLSFVHMFAVIFLLVAVGMNYYYAIPTSGQQVVGYATTEYGGGELVAMLFLPFVRFFTTPLLIIVITGYLVAIVEILMPKVKSSK
jgi:hypothetical protein